MDKNDLDERNWHEWQQLFVEGKPVANTLSDLATSVTEETGGQELESGVDYWDISNMKLDELELVDYLQNKGQWPEKLVSESPVTVEQIVNPPQEVVAPTGKGKGGNKDKAAADAVTFDPADLELTQKAENNFLLGDALE